MKRYHFNKLIRSKIPERMVKEGVVVNSQKLEQKEFIEQLKHKIVEEAKEVQEASSRENLITELADVIEVVYSIANASNISIEEIEQIMSDKRNVNGSFCSENYIHYIDVPFSSRGVIEYLENKDRHYKYAIKD